MTGPEVPMHPTRRDLDQLHDMPPAGFAGLLNVAGITTYEEGLDLDLDNHDGSQLRLMPTELLRQLLADARQQLANVRGTAVLFGRRDGDQPRADRAEVDWRRNNPGLSRLLNITDRISPKDPT